MREAYTLLLIAKEALSWYDKAAPRGNADAKERIAKLLRGEQSAPPTDESTQQQALEDTKSTRLAVLAHDKLDWRQMMTSIKLHRLNFLSARWKRSWQQQILPKQPRAPLTARTPRKRCWGSLSDFRPRHWDYPYNGLKRV
jgi:TPR repeat protein